jgi:hypothetical protein
MALTTCNYGGCLNDIGKDGIIVSLRRKTSYDEARAGFCCAAHAAASLLRLAHDRNEEPVETPNRWRVT